MTQLAPVVFGEVLFDCFPDGSRVLGGAPFNVAWNLQGFGLAPRFLSRIGADDEGREVLERMQRHGMDTAGLQRDAERPTGRVEVRLEGGDPSYEIVPAQAYDAIDAGGLASVGDVSLLYHGTLALRDPASRAACTELRQRAARVFIDVNLRSPWWQREETLQLLDGVRYAKLNEDELLLLDGTDAGSLEERARAFREAHGIGALILTRGAAGAWYLDESDGMHSVAPSSSTEIVDTVGAGDAFASVLLAGVLSGWPVPQMLERAQCFAAAVCGRRGATVADPAFFEKQTRDW